MLSRLNLSQLTHASKALGNLALAAVETFAGTRCVGGHRHSKMGGTI